MKHLVTSLVLAATLFACGPRGNEEMSGSDLDFILFQQGSLALSAKVKQPKITVGLVGPFSETRDELEKNLESIILKWIEPMRSMTSAPLATSVEFFESESKVDVIVEIVPGVHAHTYIQDIPRVRIDSSGYFGSYNVVLHEFGHAFALLDTYQSGQSGNCQPGQPQAVMCNTSFADLQPDDIKGIQTLFKSGFPGDQPGATLPTQDTKINVAINDKADGLMIAAVSGGTVLTTGAMEYCTADDCSTSEGAWQSITANSAGIFETRETMTIAAGLKVSLRYVNEGKRTSRTLLISAR